MKWDFYSFSIDDPTPLKACALKFDAMVVPKDFDAKLLDESLQLQRAARNELSRGCLASFW